MKFFKTPVNGDEFRNYNMIIGHIGNFAIIENEFNKLFFIECDSIQMPIGTVVENDSMQPITLLPEVLQNEINEFAKNLRV